MLPLSSQYGFEWIPISHSYVPTTLHRVLYLLDYMVSCICRNKQCHVSSGLQCHVSAGLYNIMCLLDYTVSCS